MARLFCAIVLSVSLFSCAVQNPPAPTPPPVGNVSQDLDYSLLQSWAAHPWKKGLADSVPAPLRDQLRDSIVDVFFVHPTTYTGARAGANADPTDSALNLKTDQTTILYQATAFNQHARLFAPRYRQAHLSAFFTDSQWSARAFDTAYADVKKAFLVYMATWNGDRPFIIAAHSQGTKLAERLILEFIDGKPLQSKLIAAYLIGWPIPSGLFKKIPACTDAASTGCALGWRTFRAGYLPPYILKEKEISIVVNPLSWTTTHETVSRMRNKGSVLRNFNQVITHTTDATIHDGVLWVNRPRFPGGLLYRTKNYHIADINLFYLSIRENVALRISAYRSEHPPVSSSQAPLLRDQQ